MKMNQKQLETWAPWVLLVLTFVIWQAACSLLGVSEFVFPSPLRIWQQMVEYRDVIAGHAWRTFWVTMVGFGIAIVVGVLLATSWLLGRASGNPRLDAGLWLLTLGSALLIWRTRLHLLWMLGAGAALGALGWV